MSAGLAGGAYFRRAAILDAFSVPRVGKKWGKEDGCLEGFKFFFGFWV